MLKANQQRLPFNLNVIITEKHGQPAVELRRLSSNPEVLKVIVSCAFHGQPITVIPKFSDTIKSIGSLVDKGVLYRDEEGNYFYNI